MVAAAALAAVAWAPEAAAFRSVSKGTSPHDDVTGVAAELGWPEDAVEALQGAVRQADISDFDTVEVDGEERLVVTPVFAAEHHCDRVPPGSDAEAFNATVAYVAKERGLADNLSLIDPWAAMRALGRALHALQDCYSHTNIVDLDPVAQGAVQQALLDGGPMPEGLVLCGSDPGRPPIGMPPGDPYPHDERNKDTPDGTAESELVLADGRTKHEAALDLARGATSAFLSRFMADLDVAESDRLLAVDDDSFELDDRGDGSGSRLGVPDAAMLAAPALALAAVAARRRSR